MASANSRPCFGVIHLTGPKRHRVRKADFLTVSLVIELRSWVLITAQAVFMSTPLSLSNCPPYPTPEANIPIYLLHSRSPINQSLLYPYLAPNMDLFKQHTSSFSDAEKQSVKDSGKDVPLSFANLTGMRLYFQVIYSICFVGAFLVICCFGTYSILKHAQKKANE